MYNFNILFLISFLSFTSANLIKRQVCDYQLAFCSPKFNETWYQHNFYQFVWNQNFALFSNTSQTSTFDIHLLTISRQAEQRRRTIKSWFNLTNTNSSFDVQVTDDWFPTPLPSGSSNLTWTVYVFLLGRDRKLDPTSNDINLTTTAYVELQVVQSSPIPIIIDRDIFSHQWIIVIVMVSSFLAIAATCIIVWLYKNMQKHKKQQERQEQQQKEKIILSAPDAMMIANKFRQVMSNSELLNQQHIQVGEDLLKRQLASEHNMSVSEVERRTSSFSRKTACS